MKNYFDNLDIIVYENTPLKDLFKRYKIVEADILNYLKEYFLQPEETFEEVSFRLYGSNDYWWVIALVNETFDPLFDCPLDNESLIRKVQYQYDIEVVKLGDTATDEDKEELYTNIENLVMQENLEHSKIKVVPANLLIQFLVNLEYA